MVVLVVYDVHFVVADVGLIDFLLFLVLVFFQENDILAVLALDNDFLLLFELADSPLAHGFFVEEELLILVEVGRAVLGVEG